MRLKLMSALYSFSLRRAFPVAFRAPAVPRPFVLRLGNWLLAVVA